MKLKMESLSFALYVSLCSERQKRDFFQPEYRTVWNYTYPPKPLTCVDFSILVNTCQWDSNHITVINDFGVLLEIHFINTVKLFQIPGKTLVCVYAWIVLSKEVIILLLYPTGRSITPSWKYSYQNSGDRWQAAHRLDWLDQLSLIGPRFFIWIVAMLFYYTLIP